MRKAGAGFLALDLAMLDAARWDEVAVALEAGRRLWAGLDLSAAAPLDPLLTRWHELGLRRDALGEVGVIPPCGLAGATPEQARAATTTAVELAARLAETARG